MQSGKIKHWNSDKGYGFIDVDNQNEDVFFHVTTVRLSQSISEGQRVYFNSQRNEKNQLRATEVTSNEFSILETAVLNSKLSSTSSSDSNRSNHSNRNSSNPNQTNTRADIQNNNNKNSSRRNQSNNHSKNSRGSQQKKSSLSILFSLMAIIAVAIYFFADLKSSFFADGTQPATVSQTSSEPASASNAAAITGDAQID